MTDYRDASADEVRAAAKAHRRNDDHAIADALDVVANRIARDEMEAAR